MNAALREKDTGRILRRLSLVAILNEPATASDAYDDASGLPIGPCSFTNWRFPKAKS
jgi:hypothetical protein